MSAGNITLLILCLYCWRIFVG